VGYNAPEHRKRQHTNLSVVVLNSLSSSLFLNLLASFRAGSPWQCLQKEVESIATSISNYATYIPICTKQNKKMTDIHLQSNSVRQLSDSLSIKHLKSCHPPEQNKQLFTMFRENRTAISNNAVDVFLRKYFG